MKILTTVLIMLIVVSGCTDGTKLETSVLRGQHVDMKVLAGVSKDNTGMGLLIGYNDIDDAEWGPEPDFFGGYIQLDLTQDVTITDTPAYSPIKGILETLHAQPYIRAEFIRPVDRSVSIDSLQPAWIAGTKFKVSQDGNFSFNVEYLDGDFGEEGVFLGLQARF